VFVVVETVRTTDPGLVGDADTLETLRNRLGPEGVTFGTNVIVPEKPPRLFQIMVS